MCQFVFILVILPPVRFSVAMIYYLYLTVRISFFEKAVDFANEMEKSQLLPFGRAGSVLYIWLVAQYYFQLYNVNSCFLSALGTVKRKSYKDGIFIYLCPGFIPAYRTWNPTGKFIYSFHTFSCYSKCRSALKRLAEQFTAYIVPSIILTYSPKN